MAIANRLAKSIQLSDPEADVAPARLLPLESGDRLTRPEFERRYEAMPHLKKAELIEGIVYMPSPVHFEHHGEPHAAVIVWLGLYWAATPGVRLADNTTVRLDNDNEPQPDVFLRIEEVAGGQSRVSGDDFIEGPPELIVEIAASSASYDLHDKLNVYRRNGVQEYLVWRVYDEAVDWFELREGRYQALEPDATGVIRSRVFPGLQLAVTALLAGDLATVLAQAQQGLKTEEHALFVEKLARKKDESQ